MRILSVVIVASTMMLAACSSAVPSNKVSSLSVNEYDNLAQGRQIETKEFEPSGFVIDESHLALLLFGSSSCPPSPVGVEERQGDLYVDTKDYGDVACTADYGPSAYKITLPSGIDTSQEFRVILDDDAQRSLLIAPLS